MRFIAAALVLLATLACVPSVKMTKAELMQCVKTLPNQDEFHIAAKYGVPAKIQRGPDNLLLLGVGGPGGWIWTYAGGTTYHFDDGGKILQTSTPAPTPTPH